MRVSRRPKLTEMRLNAPEWAQMRIGAPFAVQKNAPILLPDDATMA
jgi:hypothetical protein